MVSILLNVLRLVLRLYPGEHALVLQRGCIFCSPRVKILQLSVRYNCLSKQFNLALCCFSLDDPSISETETIKVPNTTVLNIFPCRSTDMCFMYLCTSIFLSVLSYSTEHFITDNFPGLFLIYNLLPDRSMAMAALSILFQIFVCSLGVSLEAK